MSEAPEVKTFFIPAKGIPLIQKKTVKIPTGETKKGFLGFEKQVTRKETQEVITGYSDCAIDGNQLVKDMHQVINPYFAEGFELLSITPVTSGNYYYKYQEGNVSGSIHNGYGSISGNSAYGYGYGYSYTEGLIVVLKK